MPDTYHAQIDGFDLDIETLEDCFGNSIAKYEFPYKDGAELENMGQAPRTIKCRCYWGATASVPYGEHIDFINHLANESLFEFMHPKYGLLKGMIETFVPRHDDRDMLAEVDFTFTEDLRDSTDATPYCDVEAATEEGFIQGQQDQEDACGYYVTSDLLNLGCTQGECNDIISRVLNPSLGILVQFPDVSFTARQYLKQVDAGMTQLTHAFNTITNPTNSLLGVITYATTLPGMIVSAIAQVSERYAIQDNNGQGPVRYLSSLNADLSSLETSIEMPLISTHITIAAAQRLAVEAAYVYAADDAVRQQVDAIASQPSFDARGNYLNPSSLGPIMTVNDLENSLAIVRTALQACIDTSRQMQDSLKAMALALLTEVETIKVNREKIITVNISNPTPLHLICLQYGLPYNYADRIMGINNIPNPNFTQGSINIYAAG